MTRYDPIPASFFMKNRQKLAARLKPNSIAIINANDQFPKNGDQTFPFRQNADLFYLSGLEQEKTILLLFPDCKVERNREIVFILESNESLEIWEGHKYRKDEVTAISGVQNVMFLGQFEMVLHELLASAENVYLNLNEHPRFTTEVPYRDKRFSAWMHEHYPHHHFERLAPLMTQLRLKKEPEEIDLMKKAIEITHKGFLRVLKTVRPGMKEYELQAEIDHEFTISRASGHAYQPIVASGKNALCLHYESNNDEMKDGDLVLLDFGADYANYASDLSRTIPVNGRFTPRQKEVYHAVLETFYEARNLIRPGTTIDEINGNVNKIIEKQCIKLGLFTEEDVKNQNPDKPLYFKYFMHGNSHFLGLDVHDCGTKQTILEPGMVLTCEPGIYIAEENIGIRIENDVLVTDGDPVDLMEHIPIRIEEIEQLMNE